MKDNDYLKRIEEERKRMYYLIENSDEELSMDQFLEKYASEEYKEYIKKMKKDKQELREQGITIG